MKYELVSHPATPARIDLSVRGGIERHAGATVLELDGHGAIDSIALPPRSAAPARRDRLWEQTCFEAFLTTPETPAYVEVNLSPSGDWALWAFDDYRAGMRKLPVEREPVVELESTGALRIRTPLPVDDIARFLGAAPSLAGLAAVIEESTGAKSYWACRHPSLKRPDFHLRAAWAVAF